ncbi:MAG TPA: DUF6089 family protein [Hanamia sp.]|nr:DUF6089 family protein [Hanamia sp.]
MKKLIFFLLTTIAFSLQGFSQMNEFVQEGEFGITAGVAHYFGDLNNRSRINRPKLAIGGFIRKQFGDYTAVRLSGHFARLGYSDIYSSNEYDLRRNLSFNTNIFELALQGDFNFFKFNPADPEYTFTPYATLGVGVFNYNPYAYYKNQKVFLRPLHTEGQTFYKNRKEYGSMALCFPIGFGVKYALNDRINVSFEITHRFTTTDYLDDVSTTYVGADKFPSTSGGKSIAGIMQDRSFEVGTPIGIEGRQRGFSKQKDQYTIAEVGISFNITSYRCPTAKP